MAVDRLQNFVDLAADAPPERDARHFRTWQRVSVQVQREVRSLAAQNFFAGDWRPAINMDQAYTIVVYSSCQPCFGRRPVEFTYDIGDLVTLTSVLRLIGRGMKVRLAQVAAGIQSDPRLRRRFLPVWHADILKVVKAKPRTLIEMLAREAIMINALIDLGTTGSARTQKRFERNIVALARILGIDSGVLQDFVLRVGSENLVNGRIFEDDDVFSPGSPDSRIGGDEYRDDRSPHGCGQVTDAGVIPDVHACC